MATIDSGQKAKVVYQLINTTQPPSFTLSDCEVARRRIFDCNYTHLVLADNTGIDLQNDKTSFLGMFEPWTTGAVFVLQKEESGVFVDKETITDNTFGEWFPQGSFAKKPAYSGFVIHWEDVLPIHGIGDYRIKVTETNPLNPTGIEKVSFTMCLKDFGCSAPDNTVRLEWYNNNKLGDITNDRKVLDFADINWYNQFRLTQSIFAYPKSEYEDEEIQYTNGEFQDVTSVQTETYELTLGQIPSYLHDILKTLALMSQTLEITDYSSNNPAEIIKKAVKKASGWEPNWKRLHKCATVKIELQPRFNRLEIDQCD